MTTTRPRTTGVNLLRRQSFRPYYEPFSPKVEEIEENEAFVLRLELPDFNGQQVRVKIEEETRTVGVTGDRHIGNNRWIHLDKTYPVPQNCIIDKIDHKFDNGVLTITMPKETAEQAAAAVAVAPPPKEAEQQTTEQGKEDAAQPEPEALPKVDSKTSSMEKPTDDDDKGKPAELEKQVSEKVKEETPKGEAVEPKAEKGPEEEKKSTPKQEQDSGEAKTTQDQKIGGDEQKPEEKKESKDEIPGKETEESKEKESETDQKVGDQQEKAKIMTPAPAKLAGSFAIGRLPLPLKAIMGAAVVIVAAYFAYTYFGRLPTN